MYFNDTVTFQRCSCGKRWSITRYTIGSLCYFSISFSSRKRCTLSKFVSVDTATLLVFTLCLRKNLASFRLFLALKDTCIPRLKTLVMVLIPPGLLMNLHILSISPSVIILISSVQSMHFASVITRSDSAENPIRT